MSFLYPCMKMCYLRRKFAKQFTDYTMADRISIEDTGAFYFDNIVLYFCVYGFFCLAGSVQQAQQSTHLAEGQSIVSL